MGRIFWIDNTAGVDTNSGLTYSGAFATFNKAISVINSSGAPGDTIRICYTGQDYAYISDMSTIGASGTYTVAGSGWGSGEFFTIEGHDPSGGYNRPHLSHPGGASSVGIIPFTQNANYWYITDLWLKYATTPIASGAGLISVDQSIADNESYFKVRNCYAYGDYTSSANESRFVRIASGGKSHFDIQHCYLHNIRYAYYANSAAPLPVGLNISSCIGYNGYRPLEIYIRLNTDDEYSDLTCDNNSFICFDEKTASGFQIVSGSLDTSRDSVSIRNNYMFWCNFLINEAGSGTIANDVTNYVGYNVLGGALAAGYQYFGGFDVCETNGDVAEGDVDIQAYSQEQGEAIFKDIDSTTYLWPETGWITVPDMRPVGAEMTGTWEDTTAGLKGAIQYSGVYNDSSVDTTHYAFINNPQTVWETTPLAAAQQFSKGGSFEYTSSYGASDIFTIEKWGYLNTFYTTTVSTTTIGTKVGFTFNNKVDLTASYTNIDVYAYGEGWLSGPSTDDTKGNTLGKSFTVQWNIGASPPTGNYTMYKRAKNIITDVWESWVAVDSFSRP